MKKIIRSFFYFSLSLSLTNFFLKNLRLDHDLTTLFQAALVLTFFELLLKPIIKILLLPINFITLGSIRILINLVGLYLAILLVSGFFVLSISQPVIIWPNLKIEFLQSQGIIATLYTSIFISLFYTFLNWLRRK
jgi:uncharacterized membrane protein YvlD (DUF360 family)